RLRRRAKRILSPFMGGKPAPDAKQHTAHWSGFCSVQPGCPGVAALGPWLCVPDFRPVCPGTFAAVTKNSCIHTGGSNRNSKSSSSRRIHEPDGGISTHPVLGG